MNNHTYYILVYAYNIYIKHIWEILTSHNIIRLPNYTKGGLGSLIMATLTWRIFMIFDIFLIQVGKSSDFLDPELFNTRLWLQDPSKSGGHDFYSFKCGSQTHKMSSNLNIICPAWKIYVCASQYDLCFDEFYLRWSHRIHTKAPILCFLGPNWTENWNFLKLWIQDP